MKAIVINLDDAVERMAFQDQQLNTLGIDFKRLSAFKIEKQTDLIYQKYFKSWQRPMSVSEVSCFLSHTKAWQQVLDENAPMLILEDDAWLDPSLPCILKELETMKDQDYITLEVTGTNKRKLLSAKPITTFCSVKMYRVFQGRSGAGGYVLWPNGARKLLNQFESGKVGIADKFINSCYSLKSFQIDPAVIIQLDQCVYFGIKPPLEVNTSITARPKIPVSLIERFSFKFKRILGEYKVGKNLIINLRKSNRRELTLSEYFKQQ